MPKFFKFLFIITLFNCFPIKIHALTKTTSTTNSVSVEVPSTSSSTDNIPPLPPILIFPTNNTYLNNPNLHFIWRQTTDPNSNTLTYTLHLNQQNYPNLPSTANLIKTKYHTLAKTNTFSFFLTSPLNDGTYTWFVTAADANHNQTNSATFHFILDTQPPLLTLTTIDQYQNLNLTPSNSPISLKFNPNHTTHQLTLNTEPNTLIILTFTNLFNSQTQSLTQTCPPSPNPCQLTFNLPLTTATYKFQISAFDQAHNLSNLPSITLTPLLPTSPTTFLPATLAQIQTTRQNLAITFLLLIAIILILLLIHQKKRWNLQIFISSTQTSLPILIHLPPHTSTYKTYKLKASKRYHIPHLQPHSTLIFHFPNQSSFLSLCLLSSSPHYQIYI